MTEPWSYLLLAGVGFVSGALNVVAGGGSFLTLPVLIFLGLPAAIANGTNRVGVLMQNVAGVWGFHRHRVLDWRSILWAGVPASAGAIVGTYAALDIGDVGFRRILATAMVAITLWTVLGHKSAPASPRPRARTSAALATGFFFVGIYGGFLQAGVGFMILALTSMAGLDLVRGNAVKVLCVLVLTGLSLAIFAANGSVNWPLGVVLGLGNATGAHYGVRLAVTKGHDWLKVVVSATVIAFAIKLWFF